MNELIEVTEAESKAKVLVPICNIKSIVQNGDGTAFIEMSYNDKRSTGIGFSVLEKFVDIKLKLLKYVLAV